MNDTKSIEVATDRANAINFLKEGLRTMFPDTMARVVERRYVGEDTVGVLYTHYKNAEQCQSGILENDPCFMYFVIFADNGRFYAGFPSTHCGRVFDSKAVKFRKITGNTQLEVAQKLIKWFSMNQAHILKVGNEYHAQHIDKK